MAFYKYGEDEFQLQAPEWLKEVFPALRTTENGAAMWVLGDEKDGYNAPGVSVLDMPPNYTLFKHAHPCYRFEIIVRGEMTNEDGVLLGPGDVMTAEPGEFYGPHTAGPEGCVTLEVFSALEGAFRVFEELPDGTKRETDARKEEMPETYEPIIRDTSKSKS